ncbi:acyl-CoA dehydrogenase family protein [Achromobacter ruhlandii]|uniref:acyl-CoA dehydrogenase family protein n=1 Tax=Achromobacter ruhlandii TaxID=72557 RepID=UPI002FCE0014
MESMLGDAANRLFAQTCTPDVIRQAEQGQPPAQAWQACEDAGFADALVPESRGGAGLALADALPLATAAGRHLCPYPIVDTLLARAWLAHAGHAPAPRRDRAGAAWLAGIRAPGSGRQRALDPRRRRGAGAHRRTDLAAAGPRRNH